MCRYEFMWSRLAGIAVGKGRTRRQQLIKFCLVKLVELKGLTTNCILRPVALNEAIFVSECLGNMKASFL